MEKYNSIWKYIHLPYSKETIDKAKIIKNILEKNSVIYITLDGDFKIDANDLYFIKRKIECAFDEILNIKAMCVIESSNPDISNLNLRQSSDISGMFSPISDVSKTICIISGKGGVGKSTVAITTAYNLKNRGFKVGIVDLDIYGPSIPIMMEISHKHIFENGKIKPYEKDGMQFVSIGMMIDTNEPIIWRGPMLSKAINQLTRQVAWQNLDYLIIDTPPGTGDIHISLAQKIPIDNVIAVCTNDAIAIKNTIKCINMFLKMGILVDTLVVNMAYIENNGVKSEIFGNLDKANAMVKSMDIKNIINIPFLQSKKEIYNYSLILDLI